MGNQSRKNTKIAINTSDITLRQRAEEFEQTKIVMEPFVEKANALEELQRTIHELHVHQTELEMQNEELRRLQIELSDAKARYFDLYDMAPVGYLTVSDKGIIKDANLTASTLLGLGRNALVNKRFTHFIFKDDQDNYYLRRKLLIESEEPQSYDLRMINNQNLVFWVHIETTIHVDPNGVSDYRIIVNDISVQKRSENMLKESEERYRQIVDNISDVVWTLDMDLNTTYISPSVWKLFGELPAELIGSKFTEQFPPHSKKIIEQAILEEFKKENNKYTFKFRTWMIEAEQIRADGSIQWISMHMSFLRDEYGKVIGYQGVSHDITKRKRIEDRLKQNNKDLLQSQRIARLGTWNLNLKTNQVVWSEELYKIYGFDSELPPPPYTEHMKLFTDESWMRLSTALEHTRSTGVPYELELQTINSDGFNGWIWVRGEAEKDSKGNVVAIWGAAQDITERKRNEATLIENEEKYRLLYASMSQGLALLEIVTNENGEPIDYLYLDINESYSTLLRVTREMCIGKKITEVMPNAEQYWTEAFGSVALTGVPRYYENYLATTGAYYSIYTYSPKKNQIAVLVTNITDKKKHEEELTHLSYHDHLTGLYNRRFFEEELFRLDTKRNLPISIVMADINGLKLINDSFGHEVGDHYLVEAGEIIKSTCRADEIVARLGGDEFCLLLPKTDRKETGKIVKRLENVTRNTKTGSIALSIAYGHDTKENETQSISEIMTSAENNMYKHKIVERLSKQSSTVEMIMSALFEKSIRESEHSKRVSLICEAIATQMGFEDDDIQQIRVAGLVHDIGKIGVNEAILNKTGNLENDELISMKRHPEAGWRILNTSVDYLGVANSVLHHHEKFDGSGYPNGLKGTNIPLQARIIAVADAYDAMTSARSYKQVLSKNMALIELETCAGSSFDPKVVDVFLTKVANRIDSILSESNIAD